ncbi:MAG: Gfo/Idh/MocA family oxidoreductase, partial [Armatimonadetes bacterium]|nr:Gfo/Idh/MocA family oxidoreductase [Armatimonadota bacterium]
LVAQVLRFWPEWLWLKRTVDSGEYGQLVALNIRRVISMPDWSKIGGNFGEAVGQVDLSAYKRYGVYDDLLADADVDMLDICLPTPMHADAVVKALEAGKHVQCEKPIALTVADADRMIAAAKANGRHFTVGQVIRLWPEWSFVKQALDDGRFGQLVALNIRRVISKPAWSADLATNLGFNGGPLIDLHIHDVDFILYLLGKPKRLLCTGKHVGRIVTYISVAFDYGDEARIVSAQVGMASTKARPFQHSFEVYFENATLSHTVGTEPEGLDAAQGQSGSQVLTIYHDDGTASQPDLPPGDGFGYELQHAVDCVNNHTPSPIIGAQSARESLAMVHLETEAVLGSGVVEVG